MAQTRDLFAPPDWHPDNHPAAPEIVLHGRRPDVRACGYCHLPNGQGRPENAPLVGHPAAYIVQQMADFKSGARMNGAMAGLAKAMTDEEVQAAANYFASVTPRPWIRVVETATVPKTRVQGGMYMAIEPEEREPLGQRIIEVPESIERVELRDSEAGFIAYAPVGSIKRGEALVTADSRGKTVQCGICHGADLMGLGPAPAIASRSPSYLGRQLWNLREGRRAGPWSAMMKGAVAKLTDDDIVSIAAYLASRPAKARAN